MPLAFVHNERPEAAAAVAAAAAPRTGHTWQPPQRPLQGKRHRDSSPDVLEPPPTVRDLNDPDKLLPQKYQGLPEPGSYRMRMEEVVQPLPPRDARDSPRRYRSSSAPRARSPSDRSKWAMVASRGGYFDKLIRERDHPPRKYSHKQASENFERRKPAMLERRSEEREHLNTHGTTRRRNS